MKHFLLILFFSGQVLMLEAQKTFIIKTPAEHGGDSVAIPEGKNIFSDSSLNATDFVINRQIIYATTIGQKVKTNYPEFDTILYNNLQIISRFKPDESYVIVGACCLSNDILPEKAGNLFNENDISVTGKGEWSEQKFDSIRNLYYDQPVGVKFGSKFKKKYSNHFAYYPEASGFPSAIILKNAQKDKYYYPWKGWFRSNFTTLLFATMSDSLITEMKSHYGNPDTTDVIEEIFIDNVKWDASVSYRFFHDENLEVEYDAVKNKINLKIVN